MGVTVLLREKKVKKKRYREGRKNSEEDAILKKTREREDINCPFDSSSLDFGKKTYICYKKNLLLSIVQRVDKGYRPHLGLSW